MYWLKFKKIKKRKKKKKYASPTQKNNNLKN